jgi:transposase
MARALDPESAASSLGELLDLGAVDEEELYEAMDWLLPRQAKIEQGLAKRHLAGGSLVLYDLTSTWFEGRKCPLAHRGYSRDGKPGTLQIEFGLLCDAEGCPVAVEVFEGNVADPMTVATQVRKLRRRFGLSRVVVVGDRGMLTEARVREDLATEGLDWITTLRAPAIRELVAEGVLQPSLFDERDLVEITSEAYPGERLVVCRNPFLAEERSRKREELLAATERLLETIAEATRRERNPLRGEAEIGLRLGRVIDRYKVAKHFILAITDEGLAYRRDAERIGAEASLDGIYVVRTSVPAEQLEADAVVTAYKGLSRVERAFRSLKTVDLMVRPIHHRLADRVRAHVFLCMLSYYVEWRLRRAWAPLLFDDEDRAGAAASRTSAVAPAERSESAQRKASRKRTVDGLPTHSFRTLLADLATLTRNRCVQPQVAPEHELTMLATPTPLQQRAFDLLGLSLGM